MKQFFILVSIFLLCFVIHVPGSAQEEVRQSKNIAVESSASDTPFIISWAQGLFNPSANKENGHSFQRLFPGFQKFYSNGLQWNENTELKRKNEISNYVFFADCQIVRLEGKDIIHPFNYFW